MAVMPVPMPTPNPQSATRCHGLAIEVASSSVPQSSAMASTMVRRTPMRSAIAAQKGPISP